MSQTIEIDGQLAYIGCGPTAIDATRPSLVFIHGAGMDHTVWALQSRYFASRGWNVIALDLPGHGRSDGAPLPTIADMAGWLWKLLSRLGLARASLVGHSMGALIALEAAASAPARVDRLALFGAGLAMPVHPDLLTAARADDPLAGQLIASWGHGRIGAIGGARGPGVWLMQGAIRLLTGTKRGVLANDLAACDAYKGAADAAAKVAARTLVVIGGEDKMTPPKAGAALAGTIAGAETQLLDAGHMSMVERPDAALKALAAFLQRK